MQHITPSGLQERLDSGEQITIVDVREGAELEICSLPEVVHIPLSAIASDYTELDPDAPYAILCHHGIRSAQAAGFLIQAGFQDVINIEGGIERWAQEVDSTLQRY
ncbi:MAG: sulfurtransferase [Planctomycetes bacterium]|nr:sulfurtransferase [Planctomycetota bacterium]HJM58357.1 rhodanese-like domain-containing protein [Planctomycetota bacterium]